MRHFAAILLTTVVTTLQMTDVVGDDIINGKKVPKNSLQYMVSVQVNEEHLCGGFLISPKHVLTAAHCERKTMTVVIGNHNIAPRKNLIRYEVVRKFKPKNWFNDVRMGNDIMLLKISRKAIQGGKVITVKFPDEHYSVKPNTSCLVAGWGYTSNQQKHVNDLLALNVSTVDIRDCKKAWSKENVTNLPPGIICAGGHRQNGGVCKGDSGGPLICKSVAVGIVSFNKKGCKYPDVPNVYTDISKQARWIKAAMKIK